MRLNHVTLTCDDVARSLAFYERLGLRPIVVEPGPDGAPRYARLRCPDGDATLSLERADAEAGAGGARAGSTTGAVLYFECDDLDRRLSALAEAGEAVAPRAEMKPWLWREAELVDPDGHRVRLYHAGSYRLDPPWRLPGSSEPSERPEIEDSFLPSLLASRNHGYAEAPIPSARDEEIAAYLEGLMAAGVEARDGAAGRLGPAYTRTLLAFAERMATRAVRERGGRPALLGLVAVALAWREARDLRAAVPVLGVLHDAAARAGVVPAAVFEEAAAMAPPDVAPVFRAFLTRPDLDEIATEMGYAAGRDRDGFRYLRKWGAGLIDFEDPVNELDDE